MAVSLLTLNAINEVDYTCCNLCRKMLIESVEQLNMSNKKKLLIRNGLAVFFVKNKLMNEWIFSVLIWCYASIVFKYA